MIRERSLKIVLVVLGLFFSAAIYPVIGGLRDPVNSDTGDTMMMGIYATLGIFLLIAARNPRAHRSLIAFAAWSSFAHAVVMSSLGVEMPSERTGFLTGCARCDWRRPDCAGPGKAVCGARIGFAGVGLVPHPCQSQPPGFNHKGNTRDKGKHKGKTSHS